MIDLGLAEDEIHDDRYVAHFLVRQAVGSYFKAGTVTGGSERAVSPIDGWVGDGTQNLLLWLTSPRLSIVTEVRNKIPHLVRFEICQNGSKSPSIFSVSEANGGTGLTQYLRYGHRAIPHSHHRHLSHAPAYLSPWATSVGVSNAPHLSRRRVLDSERAHELRILIDNL